MSDRLLAWAGIDDPSRRERATVRLAGDGMRAIGGAQAAEFVSSWELDVGPGWITRALRVTTRGHGWARHLDLARSGDGEWAAVTRTVGASDLPDPGIRDATELSGALDCDLGLCPVTNTMPVRRLRLLDGGVAPTRLVMAWVDMPSLRVIPSDQTYASAAPGHVRYESGTRDFRAELSVDEDGIVVDYPHLARRLDPRE